MKINTHSFAAAAILISILLFFFSCDNNPNPGPGEAGSEAEFTEGTEIVDEVEVPVVSFQAKDAASLGSAFWHIETDSGQGPFQDLEISLKKESGYDYGQYGIIFCYQDDLNFYLLTIDVRGGFAFQKVIGGTPVNIIAYSESGDLTAGYDVFNAVKVQRSANGKFDIYFNGTLSASMVDCTYHSGTSGYFVYVASESKEVFPSAPVAVVFTEI